MDPLSFAASIIALLQAAQVTAQVIEKLCRYFDAPEIILQLLNEVSDFRIVLASVQETTKQLGEQSLDLDNEMINYMQRLINKSGDVLFEIRKTTEGGLIKKSDEKSKERMKISWRVWLKKNKDIEKWSTTLRNVRMDIASACTILTASSVPRVRKQLQNISMIYQDLGNTLEAQAVHSHQLEKLTIDIASIQPSLNSLSSSQDVLLHDQQNFSAEPLRPLPLKARTWPQTQASIQKSCSSFCMCCCHVHSKINSPLWMKAIMGRVSIGYSGAFLKLKMQACSEKSCFRANSTLLTVNYHFPTWVASRSIVLRDRYSPLHGHNISISTPRVCPWNSQIFHLAIQGSIEAVQKLFDQGLASPYDVDELGWSALSFAVLHKRPQMSRFLLSQHADLAVQEDVNHQSPTDLLLALMLSSPSDRVTTEMKFALGFDSNASDNILAKNFSPLHRVVLKLVPTDLESLLLTSTADIDSRCSEGRTPLFWAAIRDDIPAVKVLLRFGASVEALDIHSKSVLHASLSIECLETIMSASFARHKSRIQAGSTKMAKSDFEGTQQFGSNDNFDFENFLNHPDVYKFTPLVCVASWNFLPHVKLLLAYGALTDVPGTIPPVTIAVQMNAHSVLEYLLESGVKQDLVDEELQGVLHLASSCGDLETLHILEKYLCCIDTESVDVFGYTPIQAFDNLRSTYTTEDDDMRDLCRESFLCLLSGIKYHSKDHICWANRFVVLDSDEKYDDHEISSVISEEEEHFFDAESHSGPSQFNTKVKY